jgi:transglutaminase-like putative cysteine protease
VYEGAGDREVTPKVPSGRHAADFDCYLLPSWYLDSEAPEVADFSRRAIDAAASARDKATRLYYAVRDGIWYSPYALASQPDAYRASRIVQAQSAFCVQKAILLAASARAALIPSRLRFANVRNHLTSEKLRALMGTDLFVFHGYTELYVEGKWVKATPTFNRELCQRFGVLPLEFDGTADAILHPFDAQNRRHMEYVHDHGSFADLPYDKMVKAFRDAYPQMVAAAWPTELQDPQFARSAHGPVRKG